MIAVILAGGLGTRLSEETSVKPKPMVEIGGKPILWHIMKIYSQHGINDFIVCLGYKGYVIKEYFANYFLHMADIRIDLDSNSIQYLGSPSEKWKITFVETGDDSLTGERLRRVQDYLQGEQDFCFTYGDGVTDLDITKSIEYHRENGKLVTLTAITPKSRYGAISLEGNLVDIFSEKPENMEGIVNGGFFIVNAHALTYLTDHNLSWEASVLPQLAKDQELVAYRHSGFWQSMDTVRDKEFLESLWRTKSAPWKLW